MPQHTEIEYEFLGESFIATASFFSQGPPRGDIRSRNRSLGTPYTNGPPLKVRVLLEEAAVILRL